MHFSIFWIFCKIIFAPNFSMGSKFYDFTILRFDIFIVCNIFRFFLQFFFLIFVSKLICSKKLNYFFLILNLLQSIFVLNQISFGKIISLKNQIFPKLFLLLIFRLVQYFDLFQIFRFAPNFSICSKFLHLFKIFDLF